uniref:Uncharacterized protein n=1 Tax=Helianthus annuus TaxID=4232 RepID=A0A251TDQ4_HELAN
MHFIIYILFYFILINPGRSFWIQRGQLFSFTRLSTLSLERENGGSVFVSLSKIPIASSLSLEPPSFPMVSTG